MPYQISVDAERGFVHLVYSGDVDLEDRTAARAEVFQLIKSLGLSRTLVDSSRSNLKLTVPDIIKFASSFKELEIPHGYHVACVISDDDEVSPMLEVFASTDGLNIRVFASEEEAIFWLKAF